MPCPAATIANLCSFVSDVIEMNGHLRVAMGRRNAIINSKDQLERCVAVSGEAERKLFAAASPHLRGVSTAMLETCCRPGEILSLQWQDATRRRSSA